MPYQSRATRGSQEQRRAKAALRAAFASTHLGLLCSIVRVMGRRDLGRALVASLIAVALAEGAAAVGYRLVAKDRLALHWWRDPQAAILALTPEYLAEYERQYFDPALGWTFKPTTTAISYTAFDLNGARRDPTEARRSGRTLAYGDSFTFGEGVGDADTWPHRLGKRMGQRVENFGVAGYGPDQALLRLRQHLEMGARPEVVVFGVLSENIARVVNAWRYLYTGGEVANFKPRLLIDGAARRWLPNPLVPPLDVTSVRAAAARAETVDQWQVYNERRPRPGFPYLGTALEAAYYLAFRVQRWQDLWNEPAAVRTLDGIVEEFVQLSQAHGFRPVLVMIPMPQDLQRHEQGRPSYYQEFARALVRYGDRLTVVDVLSRNFDTGRFNLEPYRGHASPYGNQVIADAVFAMLAR